MSAAQDTMENYLEQLTTSGAKDANVGVRYEADWASFSDLGSQTAKDIRELASSVEYEIRLLARRSEASRLRIEELLDSVVVRGGAAEPLAGDEEWKRAEQAQKDAKRALRPNDPAYATAGERAKYEHFMSVHLDGRRLIAQGKFKNAAFASKGTFQLRQWIAELLRLEA